MRKIKKAAKIITNILAAGGALIVGLSPIWDIPFSTEISQTIAVIIGVMGTYFLTDSAYHKYHTDDKTGGL